MRPQFPLIAAALLTTVLAGPAGAGLLGPTKASQIVTLRSAGSECTGIAGSVRADELHTSDGTILPFSTTPEGKALVVTSVDFVAGGLTPGDGINFILARVAASGLESSYLTSLVATAEASGFAHATATMPTGTVVRPGVKLCLCASTGLCTSNSNMTISGYLVTDK